jgi:hypothetical protein
MAEFADLGVRSHIRCFVSPRLCLEERSQPFLFTGYLESLGQQRLTYDLQTLLSRDPGLRRASAQYYVQGSGGRGGGREDGLMSDCSDFSD